MTSTLESRLRGIAEVLLHADRGAPPGGGTPSRLRNRLRARSLSRRSPSPGMSGHTGVAEQVAGIIEALHPDDLTALVDAVENRS